jgi:integrase/recombinase XerD
MTTEKSIEIFLNHCRFEKNLNEKTLRAYSTDLRQFTSFLTDLNLLGEIEGIDKFVIRDYLRDLSKFEPKTVKRKIASLKALFNFLEFDDLLHSNPFRKIRINLKESKKLPTCMNNTEVKEIFLAAYKEKSSNTDIGSYAYKEKVRDIAVMETLFATGIRVSELCNLKKNDALVDSGFIKVLGKGSKERVIHICHPGVKKALSDYFGLFKKELSESQYLFTNRLKKRLSEQSVRLMIRKYSKLAKLKKHVTPHTFRHTFATLLLEEDVDIKYIQKFLGHSSIMTTQIYTHVNSIKQKEILSTKHPRGRFEIIG